MNEFIRLKEAINELFVALAEALYLVRFTKYATLQKRVFDWAQATFGYGQRANGVYAHLIREIEELGNDLNDGEELADCGMLLFDLAGFAGVNLLDEVEKKLEINKARKWGDIELDGSILHIKKEGE